MPKLVLAYSGGLDTTTAIKWLNVEQGYDVIALNIDVGKSREQPVVEERGLAAGALKVRVIDAKEDFLRYFAFPALAAGAVYQDAYPLATALARPLMAKLLVDVAHEEGATAVAHGCTGKGNDQVRFDTGIMTLDNKLKIVAPTRENAMAREFQIDYLRKHGIDIPWGAKGPFSIDENLWGRSAEAGVLEDPWQEPPPDAYEWTRSAEEMRSDVFLDIFDEARPIGLPGMAEPAFQSGQHVFDIDSPVSISPQHPAQAAAKAPDIFFAQKAVVRPDAEADKRNARVRRPQDGAFFMNPEPPACRQIVEDALANLPQFAAIVVEQDEIIAIAHQAAHAPL